MHFAPAPAGGAGAAYTKRWIDLLLRSGVGSPRTARPGECRDDLLTTKLQKLKLTRTQTPMDSNRIDRLGDSADRRDFLKKAGKLAATVPAVALLLSANATPAQASSRYGKGKGKGKAKGKTKEKKH